MPGQQQNHGIDFLLTDQVGTLRAVADTTGAIVKRIDYDSFGNIIADSNPAFTVPFGFAGGLHDRDTGLVRFGYRDYSPELGRFVAKDPIDFAGGDTNLYAYSMSDPVNLADPSGLRLVVDPGLAPYINELRNRSSSFSWAYETLDSLPTNIDVTIGRDIENGPESQRCGNTISIPRDEFYESNRLGISAVNDRAAMAQYNQMSPAEQRLVNIAHEFGEMTFTKLVNMNRTESHAAATGFENRVRTQIGIGMMRPVLYR